MENWLSLKGYEGLYEISSLGRIKRLQYTRPNPLTGTNSFYPEKVMKIQNGNVYKQITLVKDGKRKTFTMHRLIALHFIPLVDGKPHVNHIDGNKYNNAIENLEWVTQSENEYHSYRVIGKKGPTPWLGKKGINNNSTKIVLHAPTGVFYYGGKDVASIYKTKYVDTCRKIRSGFDNLQYV
jgi:hypothetical protein